MCLDSLFGFTCGSRATSTKTRIETFHNIRISSDCLPVQEQHPLKQGLKLSICFLSYPSSNVQEQHPLKQGLKHSCCWYSRNISSGSRATSTKTRIETYQNLCMKNLKQTVQEQHPLKQGLKQKMREMLDKLVTGSRATSTKTRIETMLILLLIIGLMKFKSNIH